MSRIRRLNYFDIVKIQKMISYLNDEGIGLTKSLQAEVLAKVQGLLPLRFSFLPESFVLCNKKEILGLITVIPTYGNPYKVNISRLVFSENMYDVGKQLVEFVIAKFGAKGAVSYSVLINENDDELMQLFTDGCGFRQCSGEVLWRIDITRISGQDMSFRTAQNSDAKQIATLYNGELQTIYKPSLIRKKGEFKEPFFEGFSKFYKNRYVLEDSATKRIVSYLSITTGDNRNFILDIFLNEGYNFNVEDIINFAVNKISEYKSNFSLFIKQRKYTKNSENLESYLRQKGFSPIQNQHVLIKDYYRPVKQESFVKVFSLGETVSFLTE